MAWEIFFTAFGGSATALAVLGFLFKQLIETNLDRALANHKSELRVNEMAVQAKIDAIKHDKSLINNNFINKRIFAVEDTLQKIYKLLIVNFPDIPPQFKKRNIQNQKNLEDQKKLLIDGLHVLLTSMLDGLDKSRDVRLVLISHCIYLPDEITKEVNMLLDEYTEIAKAYIERFDKINDELEIATDVDSYDIREFRNEYTRDVAKCIHTGRDKIVQIVRDEIGLIT